ncbi:dihydrolipoamide acetyltransferase family protein [Nocardia sp. CA-290969]|uniref:dihydrolipoamide acetyltransferase family protein n=1 Tax=Nocardia sp. CA-290969 TaxID=3239986 RepID=UPI003D90E12A
MPTIKTFLLPDLGEGLTEADLLSWNVAIGDVIELNQIIAEVETAKASVELPSPYAGTVVALHAAVGDTIDVGNPFIDIETPEDDLAPKAAGPTTGSTETAERTPVLVGYGAAGERTSRRRGARAAAGPVAEPTPATVSSPGRPLAPPPVRFAARNAGVDLADIPASGSRGQVTRDDLDRYLRASAPVKPVAEPVGTRVVADEERTPVKGVRKHTAAAMVRSAFTAPHVTEFVDIDITPTLELLEQLRDNKHFAGVRLTPLTLVAKALLVALRTNPSLNSFWDEDAQEIVTKRYVNLGIAAATPRGLMVPNIKNAQTLGLRDLAQALSELTTTAKEGKTGPADLADGTITITNVGVFGVDSGTPILNPGEAAILCFGSIRRRPWEYQGEIALRSITTLSLSFDHRLVDGEQGSKFLATVAAVLSDPLNLIALS